MSKTCCVVVVLLCYLPFTSSSLAEEILPAQELLNRSIAYHDPQGIWSRASHRLLLSETRPNGTVRKTTLVIDNREESLRMNRSVVDGPDTEIYVKGEMVEAKLNGSAEFSEEEAEKNRLTSAAAKRTRNYYLYLYGLPMKLRDPGTRLDPKTRRDTFFGKDVLALRVTYDEDVGKDTWYFYFDPKSYALVGYRFYHDESKNDGEYITLEEEAVFGRIRLPRIRKWYTNNEKKHLGTDTIEFVEAPYQ